MVAADGGDGGIYPVFLKLEGRKVLVVGGGAVAARKVASLLQSRARVCVVAPRAAPEIHRLAQTGRIEWRPREFEEGDVDAAWLVVASTPDPAVQRRIADCAEARQTFLIAVDDVANSTAYSGAIVRRAPFTIAVSSSGATPALTRLVREIIEHVLPPEEWIEHARRLRAKWLEQGTPMGERFAELVRELAAKST